jgi:hypothetical protein
VGSEYPGWTEWFSDVYVEQCFILTNTRWVDSDARCKPEYRILSL